MQNHSDQRKDTHCPLAVVWRAVGEYTILHGPDIAPGEPNIVFITDEAHRCQYGLRGRVTTDNTTGHTSTGYGFAKHVRDALVKGVLRKYGYPPDKEVSATKTVLRQAETLCADWAA